MSGKTSNRIVDYTLNKGHVVNSCVDCHYSSNGKHGCNRLMDYVTPKIDISKGVECTQNDFVHYLKFNL